MPCRPISDSEESKEAEERRGKGSETALVNPIDVLVFVVFVVAAVRSLDNFFWTSEPTTTAEIEIGPKSPQTI